MTAPNWVTSGPDPDGNHNGPTFTTETARLQIHTAWSEDDGAVMWIDTALYDGRQMTAREAIQTAAGLLQGALLIGGEL